MLVFGNDIEAGVSNFFTSTAGARTGSEVTAPKPTPVAIQPPHRQSPRDGLRCIGALGSSGGVGPLSLLVLLLTKVGESRWT